MAELRLLAIPLFVALAAIVLYIAIRGSGRPPVPRWEAATELTDGVTVVFVRHVAGGRELGRQIIAELPDDAPDWEQRYHEAMATARSRAVAMQIESGG